MANASKSFLELTPQQFEALSDAKAVALATLAAERDKRRSRYASMGMVCGTISFLTCVCCFVYLVMNGHPKSAACLLGTAALSIVGRIIAARLA